jgi:hypothetical protein
MKRSPVAGGVSLEGEQFMIPPVGIMPNVFDIEAVEKERDRVARQLSGVRAVLRAFAGVYNKGCAQLTFRVQMMAGDSPATKQYRSARANETKYKSCSLINERFMLCPSFCTGHAVSVSLHSGQPSN